MSVKGGTGWTITRSLPTTPQKWYPDTPLVGSIGRETGLPRARLWVVMKRFLATVADLLLEDNPVFAEKLRRATPHWMRHTHATHTLHGGAELPQSATTCATLRWRRPRCTCTPMTSSGPGRWQRFSACRRVETARNPTGGNFRRFGRAPPLHLAHHHAENRAQFGPASRRR